MLNKVKLYLVVILLSFVFSGEATAANAQQAQAAATTDSIRDILTATENPNDDFHKILKGMWGGFIFGDSSQPPTILSKVVGYVNILALIMGIIITSYVVVGAVVNSASSGEVLGKQWSTYWLPLRSVIAFGLLIPSQLGAYALSTAQVLVIKLLIMASTSATLLWVFTTSEALQMSASQPTLIKPYKLAYDTSLGLTCAVSVSKASYFGNNQILRLKFTNDQIIDFTYGDIKNSFSSFYSKIYQSIYTLNSTQSNPVFLESLNFGEECGELAFNIPDFSQGNYTTFSTALANSDASMIHKDVVASNSAAQKASQDLMSYQASYLRFIEMYMKEVLVSVKKPSRSERIQLNRSNNPDGFNFFHVAEEFSNYGSSGKDFSIRDNASTGYNSRGVGTPMKVRAKVIKYRQVVDKFINDVTGIYQNSAASSYDPTTSAALLAKGGWIYAGAFFYKTSQLEGISSQASSTMAKGEGNMSLSSCGDCEDDEDIMSSIELLSSLYSYAYINEIPYFNGYTTDASARAIGLVSTKTTNTALNSSIASDTIAALAVEKLAQFGTITGETNLSGGDFGEMTENNPFQLAANIGHGMSNVRYVLWLVKSGATTSLFLNDSIEKAVNASLAGTVGGGAVVGPISAVLKAALTMLIEFLTIAITLLTAMAWTLAYYIPMMPALLWITLIGAYILISIEGVVAFPLAVILMATPEGEGISGSRFQNAIVLLASIYLRPSLMIIGLVAAIFVAKYSFHVLNVVFWSQAESAVRSDIFGFFATFTLYIVSLHQILANSIKSMESLPTAILNWIGQGANAQFGQNEVSAAASQLDSKEAAFGSAGDSFKSVFNEKREQRRENRGGE